jgi:hypothetical protein
MHCAEVAPSIALVVLSEGHNSQLSDLMHLALNSLQRIQVLGNGFQRRQRSQDIASEIPDKVHMAIRGSTNQACGYVQVREISPHRGISIGFRARLPRVGPSTSSQSQIVRPR